jgi:sugar (pentulose or hexulose) kinase
MNASLKREFPLVIGIDLGTTYTKALAIDEQGNVIGLASKPTEWTAVTNGNVESNAERLVDGVIEVVKEVIRNATTSLGTRVKVHGIGITGFAESGVIIDPGGNTLTPVVAWFDNRGEEELAQLGKQFAKEFERHTGLVCNVQSTFSTLLWFKSQGVFFGNGVMWLNALEYVAHRIGARRITEPSLASRTGLLDQGTGELWEPALAALGIDATFIPPMIQAGMRAGEVTVEWMPEETQGAVITVVGHDHSVGSVGAGAIGIDQLFNSAGTADVLLRTVPGVLTYDQRSALTAVGVAAGRHVLADRTALVGGARGGLVLGRALDLLGETWHGKRRSCRHETGQGDCQRHSHCD